VTHALTKLLLPVIVDAVARQHVGTSQVTEHTHTNMAQYRTITAINMLARVSA